MRLLTSAIICCMAAARPAHSSPDDTTSSWWVRPLQRVAAVVAYYDEDPRPYSIPVRPRDVAGNLALSCERNEGRPCGDGAVSYGELDASAGYSDVVSAAVRVRASAGSERSADLELARGYVRGQWRHLSLTVGRDVVVLDPTSRTQLSWGTNAPPFDHARLATTAPLDITDNLALEGLYAVGFLRAPQTYEDSLVTIARGQLDLGEDIAVGIVQLLQLGGDGAPDLGFTDFLLEHVRRGDDTASPTDTSNRRFGADVAYRIPALWDARLYYQLFFEDIRKARFIDAVRYDADHLAGLETEMLTVEWHQTGVRSQEHTPRTTGFTNGGFAAGSPLGPDAVSLFVGGRVETSHALVKPWGEVISISSDTYEFVVDGPINRTEDGPNERRYRLGIGGEAPLRAGLSAEVDGFYEHVGSFAFLPGSTRNNIGLRVAIVWHPDEPLGRLTLN